MSEQLTKSKFEINNDVADTLEVGADVVRANLGFRAVSDSIEDEITLDARARSAEFSRRLTELNLKPWSRSSDVDRDREKDERTVENEIARDCLFGYFVANNLSNDLKDSFYYLRSDETNFLLKVHDDRQYISIDDRNFYMLQIQNRINQRIQDDEPVDDNHTPLRSDVYKLRRALKGDYMIQANEIITDRINKGKDRMVEVINSLTATYLTTDFENIQKNLQPLSSLDSNFYKNVDFKRTMYELARGMKHEIGFKSMINYMNEFSGCEIIRVEDSCVEDDLDGIDMYLYVKLSKELDNGQYQFATNDEIMSDKFVEKRLPVDIKASCHKKLGLYGDETCSRHWTMQSHLYNKDFITNRGYGQLKSIEFDDGIYVKPSELTVIGEEFIGKTVQMYGYDGLYDRFDEIKDDIIDGINTYYS